MCNEFLGGVCVACKKQKTYRSVKAVAKAIGLKWSPPKKTPERVLAEEIAADSPHAAILALVEIIDGLWGQQAMHDDWWAHALAKACEQYDGPCFCHPLAKQSGARLIERHLKGRMK
jgi:hypothetical protein